MKSMKRFTICFFILALTSFACEVNAQRLKRIDSLKPTICYQKNSTEAYHVPPPEVFQLWRQSKNSRTKTSTIEVEYVNFPADNQARDAFQFALDIWETQLVSSVPIKVRAQWGSLQAGVLGQAVWGSAFANFDGAQHLNVYYPVALAEKISGVAMNAADEADIVATFNSASNWYFGTDGNPPAGKMDLVTIVLHEVAHGLGFIDTYADTNNVGTVGLDNGGTAVPFVYDLNVVNDARQSLFSTVASNSAAMATSLTSGNLSFNSPLAEISLGAIPKVYAPATFNAGSSIAHLDESTFSVPGDPNNLMTPQIAAQESIHSPGGVTLGILNDLGWLTTRIRHTPLKDTERKDGQPYIVRAVIQSDNGYDNSSVKLNYRSSSSVPYTEVAMTPTGNPNEFQASLPGSTQNISYAYFITVTDNLDRLFRNPGVVYEQNKAPQQNFVLINIRPDIEKPVIAHAPVDFVFENDSDFSVSAVVTDNLAVASVEIQYSIDGGIFQIAAMTKGADDNYTYTVTLPPSLVVGDLIKYRIIARDASSSSNSAQAPADKDTYTVFVTGDLPAKDSYVNDFNEESFDFIGNSFSIETPTGFSNGAIHSEHPYQNGSGPNSESNFVYQLQIPIRINASNPYIQFDEVVLVEPGEKDSRFGDADFYDYVIVEGSKDNGVTWTPFVDGYDSRANADWLSKYNSSILSDNSTAGGTSTLFRERTINMLESSSFAAGDEVKIRFRLFADQAAHGWGWAIDNLSIQGTVTGIEEVLSEHITVYPNPASAEVSISKPREIADGQLMILNANGQTIHSQEWIDRTTVDVRNLRSGLYLLKLRSGSRVFTKKLIKI